MQEIRGTTQRAVSLPREDYNFSGADSRHAERVQSENTSTLVGGPKANPT